MKLCSIEGCEKPADRKGGLCQMHSWRLRFHGDVHYVRPKVLCSFPDCGREHDGHGLCALHLLRQKKGIPLTYERPKLATKRYKIRRMPHHPLANALGRVYEHRAVFYDAVFGSRVPCFWCAAPLEWGVNLCVDHLNHDRHDNSLTNLVPSCNSCNAGRTRTNSHVRQSIYSEAA